MSTAFLCVQFRNLLPSEQLLLFARALWSDLQQRGIATGLGDATLTITQRPSEISCFDAELTMANAPHRAHVRETDALAAIERVFADWSVRAARERRSADPRERGKLDLVPETEWHSDTASR
jgi:hypothetical protein